MVTIQSKISLDPWSKNGYNVTAIHPPFEFFRDVAFRMSYARAGVHRRGIGVTLSSKEKKKLKRKQVKKTARQEKEKSLQRDRLDEYSWQAEEAFHYEDYEASLRWSLKRLKPSPRDLTIRDPAFRCRKTKEGSRLKRAGIAYEKSKDLAEKLFQEGFAVWPLCWIPV